MHTNPFRYGEEVIGNNFCNRKNEIQKLTEYVFASNKILLYSPRRWGKTSLIKETLSRLPKKDFIIIFADLYPLVKEEQFNLILAQAFAKTLTSPAEKTIRTLRSMFGSLVPKITMDPVGNMGFEFGLDSSKKNPAIVEELLDGISGYISNHKKRGIVIFDEFQQIGELPDDHIEKILRSKIQSHHNISYIFAGSKRHLLLEMFSNPTKPFYKSVIHFPLPTIPSNELKLFIINKFTDTKTPFDTDAISFIIDFTDSHPFYAQELCFFTWEKANLEKTKVTKNFVSKVIETIISMENTSYQNLFGMLSRVQKIALKAISQLEKNDTPFSSSFLTRTGITSADGFRKAMESLVPKSLIEKENGSYKLYDVFFREWLKRH